MVVLDIPRNIYGWELVARSDSDNYRMYKHENGYFQIAIVYEVNGKVYERSVSNSKGKTFEEYLPTLEYFEKEANHEELVAKKEAARKKRSLYISNRNKELIDSGIHQFQISPEISKNGAERAAEIWNKANNGEFEHEGHKEWTEKKRLLKSDENSGILVYNKQVFSSPENNDLYDKHIENSVKNIQKYNEDVKTDPILKEKRSKIQSKTSKKNWQNEEYRRSVINGLHNAMKSGRWSPPYKNSKKGWHYSPKTKKNYFYRSSYEKLMFTALDEAMDVVWYESECFRIEYYFEGELHITVPDIFINFETGLEVLAEIKNSYMLTDDLTKAKLRAMRKFAKERGYIFWLITEKELGDMGLL